MNRSVKIWLIIAASLLILGCTIMGVAMAMLNWDFSKLSTSKYVTNEYEITDSYQSITVTTRTADISFALSETGKTLVVCNEQENLAHSVTVQDDSLVIKLRDTRKWYEYIGIHFGKTSITVYLPQSEYHKLAIHASTGDVEIAKDFRFGNVDISLSTGDITNYASVSQTLKVETSTGDIRIENISAGTIDLSVNTGHTYLTDVHCGGLHSTGDTGDLKMTNVIAEGKFSIERDTGDVKLDRCDASEIFVNTSTGDVTGTLLSDKVFITETSTGKVNVPQTITGGRCQITTSTGDIQLKLQVN